MSWFPRQPRPTTLRPIVQPTRTVVRNVYEPYIVPVIHPTHTKVNCHKIYQYQHHCPQTVSYHTTVSQQHVNCNCPKCRH